MNIKNEIMSDLLAQYIATTKFRSDFKKSFFPSVLEQLKENNSLSSKQWQIIYSNLFDCGFNEYSKIITKLHNNKYKIKYITDIDNYEFLETIYTERENLKSEYRAYWNDRGRESVQALKKIKESVYVSAIEYVKKDIANHKKDFSDKMIKLNSDINRYKYEVIGM